MVDYFPVLNRAVGALDPNTSETRRGVYDRARRALVDGLRSSDPTLSDTDLRTQSAALEDAIRQVESQYEVDALRGVQPPDAPRRMPPPAAALRTPPPMLPPRWLLQRQRQSQSRRRKPRTRPRSATRIGRRSMTNASRTA